MRKTRRRMRMKATSHPRISPSWPGPPASRGRPPGGPSAAICAPAAHRSAPGRRRPSRTRCGRLPARPDHGRGLESSAGRCGARLGVSGWSLGRPDAWAVQDLVAWQAAGILPTQGGTARHLVSLGDAREGLGRLRAPRVVRVGEEALLVVRPPGFAPGWLWRGCRADHRAPWASTGRRSGCKPSLLGPGPILGFVEPAPHRPATTSTVIVATTSDHAGLPSWITSVNSKGNLPYFGHLMRRANLSDKTLMLVKIEGRKRRWWQNMRCLDGIMDSTDLPLSKLQEIVKDRKAWCAVPIRLESGTRLRDWSTQQG